MEVKEKTIQAKYINGHYEIYVDDKFYCSCDTNELKEELDSIAE